MSAISLQDAESRVQAIDLEPIVYKLVNPEPGETGLTLEEADRRVSLYRQFLVLHLVSPESVIVPTVDIDSVWHAHILDTAKYAQDCDSIFGFFLHHFPYLGLRGDEDERNWREKSKHTRALFEKYFGASLSSSLSGVCNGCGGSGCDGSVCASSTYSRPGDGGVFRERPRPNRKPMNV